MSRFQPPKASVGQVVLYVLERGRAGAPAVVSKVSGDGRRLDLNLLVGKAMASRNGVPHEGDPDVTENNSPGGYFRLTDGEIEIRSLIEAATGTATGRKRP